MESTIDPRILYMHPSEIEELLQDGILCRIIPSGEDVSEKSLCLCVEAILCFNDLYGYEEAAKVATKLLQKI